MMLSVIIPCKNEEGWVETPLENLYHKLVLENIRHELLVVLDPSSTDSTEKRIKALSKRIPTLRLIKNMESRGPSSSIRIALDNFSGDAAIVCLADGSDKPTEVVRFFRTFEREKVDCVFGSRFFNEGKVSPDLLVRKKLDRILNKALQSVFRLNVNDLTDSLKLYSRRTIEDVKPNLVKGLNTMFELPLKSLLYGHSYRVIPCPWIYRRGRPALGILTILYCFIWWLFAKIPKLPA